MTPDRKQLCLSSLTCLLNDCLHTDSRRFRHEVFVFQISMTVRPPLLPSTHLFLPLPPTLLSSPSTPLSSPGRNSPYFWSFRSSRFRHRPVQPRKKNEIDLFFCSTNTPSCSLLAAAAPPINSQFHSSFLSQSSRESLLACAHGTTHSR